MRMKPSNVGEKIREPLNVTKVLSNVMLELHDIRKGPSNVKKIRELPNVTKELLYVMLELQNMKIELHNIKIKLSNVRI